MAGANGGDDRAAVAVLGAGIMGSAMTRNLVAAGLTTRVWDRSASATGPLADVGAVVAASAREAAHTPHLEEPGKFRDLLMNVRASQLADT